METCTKCGAPYTLSDWREGNIKEIMKDKKFCFNCGFWTEKIQEADDVTFVIDGTRYHCGGTCDPKVEKRYKGHGGAKHKIKKFDSDKVYLTDNLWCQGNVPELFKKDIPDNAEFK